ncbi:hypothetical protein F4703DRAFT_1450293 [Phycomyces blakesleeanus]
MKILVSFQCDRYIHLVRPLVTVGFVSLLASQSKPAIMDPISVQCYSVLAVKVKFNTQGSGFHQVLQVYKSDKCFYLMCLFFCQVPLLSMPMIPNPSPIQSDRYIFFVGPLIIGFFYPSIVFTVKGNHQGFDLHPCFHRPGRRTRISSSSTVTASTLHLRP